MSVVSLDISNDNPITKLDLDRQLAKLNFKLVDDEQEDFYKLLAAMHTSIEKVLALPDYPPYTDFERFPRENVRLITGTENFLGAWAYQVDIRDTNKREDGLLEGKTICFKDCIAIGQVPQILGTDTFEPWIPEADAVVVTRSLEAGAIVKGLSNCENLCSSTGSTTSALGTVQNPYAEGYSAGGSSSGSAALVGSGTIDLSIGADQGGSIRIPSAFCGVVGLKPTFGLVPYSGISSNEFNADHAGPMTRSVLENALLLEAVAGRDGIDDRQIGAPYPEDVPTYSDFKPVKGMKIGILKEAFEFAALDPKMKSKVLAAAKAFAKLGAEVVEVSVPIHKTAPEIWMVSQRVSGCVSRLGMATGRRIYQSPKFFENALPWTQTSFTKAPVNVKNSIINGLYIMEKHPGLYAKTINLARQVRDSYDKVLETVDVLITPTTPYVAPRHAPRSGTPIEKLGKTVGLNTNTGVFNITGHPAMSLPIGFLSAADDADIRLPAAMQIVGKHFGETDIYKAAYAWEQAYNWKTVDIESV